MRTAVFAELLAIAEDTALATLAVPTAAVVTGAGDEGHTPATLGARQQADDGVIDGLYGRGEAERGDGIEGRLAFAGPVVACDAKAGAGDSSSVQASGGKRTGGHLLQGCDQTVVLDNLMIASTGRAKAED